MCCIHYSPHKQSAKRPVIPNIALILCVCFLVVSFLSTAFILTHANHEHDHDGPNGSCATCIHLATAENLFKQLSSAIVAAVFAFALSSFISFCLKPFAPCVGSSTLITLKVRLNN